MYKTFTIAKSGGGRRRIEAPSAELKAQQQETLVKLQDELPVSRFAHAFQSERSIVTMAENHIGREWVGRCDVTDFFPSITMEKLKVTLGEEYFKGIEHLCTNDFKDGKGNRLPQGNPLSPLLSNAYLNSFDMDMNAMAEVRGCSYSRYADDLVFSGEKKEDIKKLINTATGYLEEGYGLSINRKKTILMHRSQRQMVCGVVVNEKLNLPRKWRKNLRAEVYQQRTSPKLRRSTIGKKSFNNMVRGNGE